MQTMAIGFHKKRSLFAFLLLAYSLFIDQSLGLVIVSVGLIAVFAAMS